MTAVQMHSFFLRSPVLLVLFMLGLANGVPVRAADGGPAPAFLYDAYVPLEPAVVTAVDRAQAWVASQQRADGGWATQQGTNNTGVISYAILSLMVNGTVPGEGKYARQVGMGLQFLLNSQRDNGLVCSPGPDAAGPMYQHALSTLALAEMYGMTGNPRIRSSLIKAVGLIVDTQHTAGGWRYQPKPQEGDISVTVMQVMALRAAVEAGIYVPKETIERALVFVHACYNKQEKGFAYMSGRGDAGFARTAAGLVCLQAVGRYDDPIIPDVVAYLDRTASDPAKNKEYFWYGNYYASVGLYHYGGDPWKRYYPKIKEKILNDWRQNGHYGSLLDTSWAILVLGVPCRYLPIYQR